MLSHSLSDVHLRPAYGGISPSGSAERLPWTLIFRSHGPLPSDYPVDADNIKLTHCPGKGTTRSASLWIRWRWEREGQRANIPQAGDAAHQRRGYCIGEDGEDTQVIQPSIYRRFAFFLHCTMLFCPCIFCRHLRLFLTLLCSPHIVLFSSIILPYNLCMHVVQPAPWRACPNSIRKYHTFAYTAPVPSSLLRRIIRLPTRLHLHSRVGFPLPSPISIFYRYIFIPSFTINIRISIDDAWPLVALLLINQPQNSLLYPVYLYNFITHLDSFISHSPSIHEIK